MDSVDGKLPGAVGKQDQVKTNAADCGSISTASKAGESKNSCNRQNDTKNETEMKGERHDTDVDEFLFISFCVELNITY